MMVTRGNDGVYRTQPVETLDNGGGGTLPVVATDTMDPESSVQWNRWWDLRFEPQRLALCDGIAEAVMQLINEEVAPLERKVKDLELQLAEARGALNVLRGKEAPGSFNVRGTFDPATVYNYLDVVAFNGSSWIATRDRPGEVPGPGWQLLSSAGKRGPRGEPGPPGAPGKEGRFPPARVWCDQVYYAGDVVVYEGSTYQAVNDTGKPPTFANDWTLLAVAGHDGKSLRPRGSFDANVEYRELDAVFCDGSSHVALCDAPGQCPSNKWQLLAAAGRDGKDGATGPRGEPGERGLIGLRGEPAPTINSWRVDCASYSAVPVLSNGVEGAPLELRGLFEQFFNEVASPARA
jgi:hypothetical protein